VRILVNDKPVEALKPKVNYLLAKVREEVKGTVMTAPDATAYYIRHTSRWFKILGGMVIAFTIVVVAAGSSYEPRNAPTFILFALVACGSLAAFMVWMLRRRIRIWNEKLSHRGEGLPAAGTQISIDARGLALGVESFAWAALSLDQVEMTRVTHSTGANTSETVHIIERLSLRAGSRAFTLDRQMMQNGPVLVDNIWRRLQPKPA
jgi:hypothetical protein